VPAGIEVLTAEPGQPAQPGQPADLFAADDAGASKATNVRADISLDVFVRGKALHIVPPVVTLGIGCRRGTPREKIQAAWEAFRVRTRLAEESVTGVASIDLKKDEQGLQDFCSAHGWGFRTYGADELQGVPGEYSGSELVKRVTGVDNVCERSAVLAAGGSLIVRKYAKDGVTIAAAAAGFSPDWRDKDE
jgi:cobalt-precorrin 5A hydrolase